MTESAVKSAETPGRAGGTLGFSAHYRWHASPAEIDMAMAPPPPRPLRLATEPQAVTIDLERTAMIVIDMQNDFCSKGGWVDEVGGDYSPDRAPIAPLQSLLPALRRAGVPIIWLNWGNRPDRMNMPPNQLHLFKPTGAGFGIGDPLPGSGAHVLEKGSWAAAVVDELEQRPEDIAVDKHRISGFWDTPLDSILRNLGTKTAMFAGVNTDQCVMHSLTDANFLGYGCILVEDCCATSSPDFCTQATIWNVKRCFGFVTDSRTIVAALGAAA